ncbi:MAG: 4Fe-4S binding protein [Ignavibacteriales bacterium]
MNVNEDTMPIEKVQYRKTNNRVSYPSPYQFNLLKYPVIKRLLLWKAFPYVIQFLFLSALLGLVILSWGVYAPAGVDEGLFSKSNLVCLMIWGIWWPLMIWIMVLAGRVWCMICPLELVSRIGEKTGRLLKINRLAINKPIKSGLIIIGLYAFVQLLVAGTGLHHIPAYTAYFLTGLIAFSFVIGLIYKNGAFCKGFCPIAMTLNAYSRGSMLAIRVLSEDNCAGCKDKNCVKTTKGNIFDTKSCPGNSYPPRLKSNKDCLLCGQCIKSCNSDNLQLLLRRPFDIRDEREKTASWIMTAFIMMDSGFVLGELAEKWPVADSILMGIPEFISGYLGIQAYEGWLAGIWTIFIFPLIFWTLSGFTLKITGAAGSIKVAWRKYALQAVIIFSSGHMIKSLLKFSESAAWLPLALKNKPGVYHIYAFNNGIMAEPPQLFSQTLLLLIISVILLSAIYIIIRENFYSRINNHTSD